MPNDGLEAVSPEELSGGKWVCSFANKGQKTGSVSNQFDIPKDGKYNFWVRGIKGTGLSYRLDDAKNDTEVLKKGWVDFLPIAAAGNPHYPPSAGWHKLGEFNLKAGKRRESW